MNKRKPTLDHFNAGVLNRKAMTYILGGHVPPLGDPGDTNDPDPVTPPPPKGPYIDPTPDPIVP